MRARFQEFSLRDSRPHQRFKTLQYDLKRLIKIEQTIQKHLKREAKQYNKSYPGELVHSIANGFLSQRVINEPHEYLFVTIDDFSREFMPIFSPIKS